MVEFVSYNGKYPNLCSGTLVIRVNRKEYAISHLCSGGSVSFDEDWNPTVEEGRWTIDEYYLPEEIKQYKEEIEDVVNDNVEYGCCGGCI